MDNNNTNTNQLEPSHDIQCFTTEHINTEESKHIIASNNKEKDSLRPLRIGAVLSGISAFMSFLFAPALSNNSSPYIGMVFQLCIWYISVPLLAYSLSLLILGIIYYTNHKRINNTIHIYLWAFIPTIPLCFPIVALIRLIIGA